MQVVFYDFWEIFHHSSYTERILPNASVFLVLLLFLFFWKIDDFRALWMPFRLKSISIFELKRD